MITTTPIVLEVILCIIYSVLFCNKVAILQAISNGTVVDLTMRKRDPVPKQDPVLTTPYARQISGQDDDVDGATSLTEIAVM